MKKLSKSQLVKIIMKDAKENLCDEETIHLILEEQVTQDTSDSEDTFGQKAADKLANFAGSWVFIIGFSTIIIIWIIINTRFLQKPFDPYPFILLNLLLSCVASVQAPLIMMSQNRQEEKDRQRSENDYRVNLKTEIIIEDLHQKLDIVIENQNKILSSINDKNGVNE